MVLSLAWRQGFSTKSDTARSLADWVGVAASRGFITTQQAAAQWGRVWHITPTGLEHLWHSLGLVD